MKIMLQSSSRWLAVAACVVPFAQPAFARETAKPAVAVRATALAPTSAAAATAKKAASTLPRPVRRVLPNGLTVLVQENHAAPVVAVRMYVRTGSIYEDKFLGAGISHLFEHTLSEGTTNRTKEQVNEDVQGIGGQSNAYTSYDVTAYHITTSSRYFERAVASLSDMMQNATFPEAEVKTQQGVIHNEMNLGEDDPDRVLNKLFYETAFRVHPVRYPIIGYREQFDAITRDDIVNYYKTHYTPENTIVAVAGDVKADEAIAVVEKLMSSWPRRNAQTPVLPTEPIQSSPRRAVVEKPVSTTSMTIGWHTIPLQHPDLYALDTLAEILGGSESSRLVRELRDRRGLVSGVRAYSSTPNYDAGIFGVSASVEPGKESQVENAIWNEINKIKTSGVTASELQRAKRQIETSFIFNNSSVEDQAEQIAYDQMGTGDPEYSQRYVDRIQAVTAAQVQAMARKYIRPDGTTVAMVVPQGSQKKTKASAQAIDVKAPQLFTLANGIRLIVRENHANPTVAITATALGGARIEPKGKEGVSALMGELLTRGTAKRSAEQIAELIDTLGGGLDGFSGYNSWGLTSKWLSRDWRSGLSLLQESLLQPTFTQSELDQIRKRLIVQRRELNDDPMSIASLALRKEMYGSHPYGRSSLGEEATLQKLTRNDVVNFYRAALQPRQLVLAVYGDVNTQEVRRAVEHAFGSFKAAAAPLPIVPSPEPLTADKTRTINKAGIAQVVQFYGFPSVKLKSEDRYAVDVLDAALSGSNLPGGRLHARLRDNQLVYVVHAFDQIGLERGMFIVYAATTKPNSERVQSIIREELQKVADSPISPEELERAKTMMISSEAIENQDNLSQAQRASSDELYGLGFRNSDQFENRINAVTLADVQRAAQNYLAVDKASAEVVVQPE